MNNKINFYTLGRDLAIKKKFPSKKLFSLFVSKKELDYKSQFTGINDLYTYLVVEYEKNPEIVPLSTSWILDNYYLISQQSVIFKEAFKPRILKKLPLSKYEDIYFQIHYISKKYLEITNCEFSEETLTPFLKGYQKIYPLSSLELWILPTVIRYELLNSLLNIGLEIKEKIQNSKSANRIVDEISSDISSGKNPIKRVKKILHNTDISPQVLLSLLEDIRELDYHVEDTLDLIEGKVHEEDLNLEEFTRASVLRDLDLKQNLNNTVTSIKNFSYINWNKLFNKVSIVESTLMNDPANIYPLMDDISRDRYRHVIEDMSTNSNFGESEIARKVVETAAASNIDIQRHVGFHLIDKGYFDFAAKIGFKPSFKGKVKDLTKKYPYASYIGSIALLTTFFSALSFLALISVAHNTVFIALALIFQLIPVSNISILLVNKIFISFLSPALPPKIDLVGGIPENCKTLVVVPCLSSSKVKIDSLVSDLEKRFLSNKYNNLYFALLSDYKDSNELESEEDRRLLQYLRKKIKQLNFKHHASGFDVFYLFHRNRLFNEKENVWMGWERKRGKLLELVDWLTRENDAIATTFSVIDGDINKLQNIKYVITLDEDTMLPADTSLKLIGAMAHPLNTPVLDQDKKIVVRGYGFIQPRIIIDPEAENICPFTKMFVTESGYDSYSVAVSDIYQDLFNRSNFMGKGIFDVRVVKESLGGRFPENKLLSHDLIESCFAKAGFLSDTSLMEDFPSAFRSYLSRDNRWVRGDWQLLPWLLPYIFTSDGGKIKNPLDLLSYWMITDNLRRSLVLSSYLFLFILGWLYTPSNLLTSYIMILFFVPLLIDIFSIKKFIVHKIPFVEKLKLSLNFIGGKTTLITISFVLLWLLAFNKIRAVISALYSLVINRHLLEWTTHSDIEQLESKQESIWNLLFSKFTFINLAILVALFLLKRFSLLNISLIVIWILSPVLILYISKPYPKPRLSDQIKDKEKMLFYAKKIWSFFEEYTNEESNYLPPDNLQLSPSKKVTFRTSPTNIGLYLLSLLSSYDLNILDLNVFLDKLEKTVATLYKLPKYWGHIYNWYDIKTLEPLTPYISTVDSGNFVVSLMLLESTCLSLAQSVRKENSSGSKRLLKLSRLIKRLYIKTDFTLLYNKDVSIFSTGFNTVTKEKDSSHYDLLASEARIASYVAIALDQVELKHWFNLGRPFQIRNGEFYLMSWGGTMLEYLLPTLLFNEKNNTILSQTNKEIYGLQKKYAADNGIPWGISESNFDAFDFDSNYQYKMIGASNIALKRYDTRDLVVSPYSTFLSLMINPGEAEENLHLLENIGVFGPYGFFEAIDFNRSVENPKKGENVKIYTAHHQGMSLVAVNNVLNEKIMTDRLHNNDYIKSCEILLDEKIPEVSNVVEPNQYGFDRKLISVRRFEKERVQHSNTPNTLFPLAQIYGNGKYSLMITNSGAGYSKFKDIFINRFTEDFTLDSSGNHIYIKDIDLNYKWSVTYQPTLIKPEKYDVIFHAEHVEFHRVDKKTETELNVFVPPEKNFEIRELTLSNKSDMLKSYEITTYMEIMLDEYKAGISHPAFNKLFLETSYENGILIARRKKRYLRDVEKYAFHFAFSEDGDLYVDSYDTSRPNFVGRIKSIQNPAALDLPLTESVGTVLDPIFSIRYKVHIKPGETKKINFIYGYATNLPEIRATKDLIFTNGEIQELSYLNRHYIEAKRTHLGIDVKQELTFQKVVSRLVYSDYRLKEHYDISYTKGKSVLYRFGISGDNKLLVLKVNSKNVELVRNMVLLHEYFRLLRFQFDLVFIVDETQSYEETLGRDVYEVVESSLSHPYRGAGVYILNVNDMSLEERFILLSLAKAVFDTSLGSLDEQINLALRYSEPNTIAVKETPYQKSVENERAIRDVDEDLTYYNGLGGFTSEGKNYVINTSPENPTPLPWSNVISNEKFGTLVTESGLGYTWNINSQLNKITPWSNDFVSDPQGEVLYLKDMDSGSIFSATPLPNKSSDFKVIHSQGYSEFIGKNGNIEHTLKVFVDKHDPVKILKLTLTNNSSYTKKIECSHYVEFVLGEHRGATQENLTIEFDPFRQCITAQNLFEDYFTNHLAFMATNRPVISATSDRKKFFGSGNSKKSPLWVLNNKKGVTGFKSVSDKCGVLTTEVEIQGNSQVSLVFLLGQTDEIDNVGSLIDKYTSLDQVDKSFEEVEEKWNKLLSTIKVKTPDSKFDYLMNNWLLYQVLSCRLCGRTSFYQAAGAFGFRDQLQDVMALVYSDPMRVRDHIILCCAHQFKEGDVQHWWNYPSNAGVRTKISDDLLWLPYVVSYYIEKTGDTGILDEEVPYLEMLALEQHEESVYAIPNISGERGNVLDHCLRAINKSLNFGAHGLPLIGSGDWNDSLNSVGDEGKGESVWLGWFLFAVLDNFTKILENTNRKDEVSRYMSVSEELKKNLDEHGWDGDWYLRAFYDDGTPLGSHINNECIIDSISQSWGVISKAGSSEKIIRAMESHEKYLENKDKKLINLLTPPFKESTPFPGYIQGYPEGIRENGGQYTHGAIWAVKAYAMQRRGDKAYELFDMLNPISHSLDKKSVMEYKSEPYVMVGDVYSNPQHLGRGGWSWYTGSAGWIYRVGIEDILGFKKYANYFTLDPVIPKAWDKFEMNYTYRGSTYNVKVKRGTDKGLYIDGKKSDENKVFLKENSGDVEVSLII